MPRSHIWVKTAIGGAGVLLIALAIFNYFRVYCCAPIQLRLSGGDVCPLRSEMARTICNEVHNAGIVLESAPGTNSEGVCAAVNKGELDVGLVLGGFPPKSHPNVRQVAVLGVEPLPVVRFPPVPFEPEFKVPAIDAVVGDRPAVWIDDNHTRVGRRWSATRSAPTLLVAIDPAIGWTRKDVDHVLDWVSDLQS